MSDHHHDFGDEHTPDDLPLYESPEHADDYGTSAYEDHHLDDADEHDWLEQPGYAEDHHDPYTVDDTTPDDPHTPAVDAGDDDLTDGAPDVFPPSVDVGELPEPVDGWPWIDTGSLGVVPAEALADTPDPVRPEELAAYAGADLTDAQDPWAALAADEDPATSTLARWWQQN
ncbi:hypothetical protein [Actinoplanes sp. URMC 104]|uniref:hypothetical protein n=1 Tax=Actinoplanes sp. URMC 104 TaxID=3423409 RepID=UPI003F196636